MGNMIQGKLPIVLTAAQQVAVEPLSIQGIVWMPATSSDTVLLTDTAGNTIFQGKTTSALQPVVLVFPQAIPVTGLSLKQISSNNILLVYPAGV